MENTTVKEQKKVDILEIGMMLRLVSMEYPNDTKNYCKLAEHISSIFNVDCCESDVKKYEEAYTISEDYELENRKNIWNIMK